MKIIKIKLLTEQFFICIQKYGCINGIKLFMQLNAGAMNAIQIPYITHPFRLRPSTSDYDMFRSIFFETGYDLRFENKPKVIIDGGANVGLFSIKMKSQFPEAQVIAIEPDPENFELLQENLKPYQNVFLENCGVWSKATKLKVYDKFNHGKCGIVVEEDPDHGTINSVSISSLIEKYQLKQIDVLKIDIETSEKQVFSENFETWLPLVHTLIVELHDRIEPGCAYTFFTSLHKVFPQYELSVLGESIIIRNTNIKYPLDH